MARALRWSLGVEGIGGNARSNFHYFERKFSACPHRNVLGFSFANRICYRLRRNRARHLTTPSIRAETTALRISTYAQFHPSRSSRFTSKPPSASGSHQLAARDNRSHERSVCHCLATRSFTRVETPRLLEMSNTGFHLPDPFRCPCFSMEA